jgi:hypothetical protein
MPAPRIDLSPDDQALKQKYARLVRAAGGVDAASENSRPDMRRHSDYQRPDLATFAPIDAVRDLERITHGTPGFPIVTRYLAQLSGYTLVKLPDVSGVCTADLHGALATAMKESSDLHAGLIEALRDGKVTPAEARAQLQDCLDAAEAAMTLHALLTNIAGEP